MAAGLFALRVWGDELTEVAMVPDTEFVEQDPLELNAYQDPDMWFSRPGKGAANDPARWEPQFAEGDATNPAAPPEEPTASATPNGEVVQSDASAPDVSEAREEVPSFAVFFVHPTSYFNRSAWNATIDEAESQNRARIMVRGLASAFNQASEIWVPRYRQATFGAFLTDAPEATSAIDAAYRDVEQAFDFFLDSVPADRPIVLAGHSQGAYHITRLLQERGGDPALEGRIAMAYPIGWPISLENDLPELRLPACASASQSGCIVSWASFAEPADPGLFFRRYSSTPGFNGQPRGDSPILCVNPITGTLNGEAPMSENLGTLVPEEDFSTGELLPGAVPARCNEQGLLLIGDPPEMGNQRFPGNNYHLVDIPLFWKNLQQDVVTRMRSWQQTS
ncbi:DUF3089 domain-containing protein [Aurantiacibacter gangjinensis]|uniref:DUF3089 domain-containing protein n=1 Tax=Aurantiacibacter gangjinensis TaxID=502682 RepID=UPI00090A7985|nr:DUF3089 domain-containing protein [Aurantiacibacter gangjinensis]APE28190.1 hypothetical protein BMF35_a1361 [Aurantiacibacter gangjinensis]